MELRLGDRTYDVTHRALVMGILNRTPDSFYDKGATFELDRFLARGRGSWSARAPTSSTSAGSRPGPGPEVTEAEELDRVVPAIEALRDRFDVPLSVDTWRASVAEGGLRGRGGASATTSAGSATRTTSRSPRPGRRHRGRHPHPARPRVCAIPSRVYPAASCTTSAPSSPSAPTGPRRPASPRSGSCIDAGLDLGKTTAQSVVLLRSRERLAELGYPLLLSASNKTFLGRDPRPRDRRAAGRIAAAAALGIAGAAGSSGSTTWPAPAGSATC